MSNDKLAQALREALAWGRVYGPAIPAHQWDEMREEKIAVLLQSLAAHEAEKQAGPLKGYCRLLKYEGGVWVPATEFLPGPPADDWIKLAETDEHWRIDRRPSGPQLRRAFETAFSKPPVQNTAPPSPLAEQAGPVDGWKLVPAEPTAQMKGAGHAYARGVEDPSPTGMYAAMLAVAPPSPLTAQDKEDAELTDDEIDSIAKEWAYEPKQARRAGDGALIEYSCFTAPRLRHFVRAAIRAARAKKGS